MRECVFAYGALAAVLSLLGTAAAYMDGNIGLVHFVAQSSILSLLAWALSSKSEKGD